jgi:small subunit ribosomal protein S19
LSRSSKKGPWVEERLMARIEAMNSSGEKRMLKTWSRTSTIFPEMVGHTIAVHDGRPQVGRVRADAAIPRARRHR